MKKSPYDIVKSRYMTEKTSVLAALRTSKSSKSVARCENPKYVFVVDKDANKTEIAAAVEEIYRDKNVRVLSVNTINVKPKHYNRRGKMNPGRSAHMKKAIVTLAPQDLLDE
jgi:large subunit ribosomal protein L23